MKALGVFTPSVLVFPQFMKKRWKAVQMDGVYAVSVGLEWHTGAECFALDKLVEEAAGLNFARSRIGAIDGEGRVGRARRSSPGWTRRAVVT